ncbi:hypothetical protein PPL_09536 [Heterostelium album PN500]|uniref:Histidine kinase n=1 Tax=Heterostelium pallidum (strain ATCC 26659 / Pp 5 / PN500) TaxID=670386 RepID=D3BNC5_HETP5|nr:hypothetical protein PPL_09536 [Heterostelium album PN500]EFA76785.1 hypothetical protein PPL_09536 [Heterostelium album PN500]|eukprot:XP_020428917.1 hypothetical protein PPL_09536 [Heterostelium album PN500]
MFLSPYLKGIRHHSDVSIHTNNNYNVAVNQSQSENIDNDAVVGELSGSGGLVDANTLQQQQQQQSISEDDSLNPQVTDEDSFDLQNGLNNSGGSSNITHHVYYNGAATTSTGSGTPSFGNFRRRHSSTYEKSSIRKSIIPITNLTMSSSSSSSSSSRSPSPSLYSSMPNDINGFELGTMSPSLSSTHPQTNSQQNYLKHKHYTVPSLSIPTSSYSAPASSTSTPTPISPNTSTSFSLNNSNTNSSIKYSNSHSSNKSNLTSSLNSQNYNNNSSNIYNNSQQYSYTNTPISPLQQQQQQHQQQQQLQQQPKQSVYEKVLHIFHFILSAILAFNIFILISKHFFSKIYQWSGDGSSLNNLLIFIYPLHLVFAAMLFFILILQSKVRSLFLDSKSLRLNIHGDIIQKLEVLNNKANSKQPRHQTSPSPSTPSSPKSFPQLPEIIQLLELIKVPNSASFSQTLDFILLGVASSGLINITMIQTYFNPSDEQVYQDSIFNICSAIEFLVAGIIFNFGNWDESKQQQTKNNNLSSKKSGNEYGSGTSSSQHSKQQQQKQQQRSTKSSSTLGVLRSFIAKMYLCLSFVFILLVARTFYEPLGKIIPSSINNGFGDISFYSFQSPVLVIIYFLQIVLLVLEYYERSSYRLATFILATIFVWLTTFNSYHLTVKLFETFNLEKLILRRWIKSNPMMGFLNDTDIQPQQAPYLHKISKSFELLAQMSKECLFYSELKALKPSDCERAAFNMETLLEEVISNPTIRNYFEEKELDLCYLLSPNIPLHLIGDSHKLKNILLRLLNNSLKATYQGEIVIRVTMLTEPKPNEEIIISFSVTDTGCGIDAENVPFLFQPYAMSQYGYDSESLGLGLAICKQLSTLMGGSIRYSSNTPEGAVFTLCLPFVTQHLFKPHPSFKWGTSHKVLIIDDNSNITSAIEMHLDPLGFNVIKAHNISQGISIIKSSKDLSIIFLDSMLPGLNIDEIKQLKFDPTKTIKNPPLVLMCTNKQRKSYSNQGLHFLFKPIKKEQLLTITHSIATSPSNNVHIPNTHQSSSYPANSSPNAMSSSSIFPPSTSKSSSTPGTPLTKQTSLPNKMFYSKNSSSGSQVPNRISQGLSSSSSSSTSNPPSPQTKITLSGVAPLNGGSILNTSGSFFSPITPSQSPSCSPLTSPILRPNGGLQNPSSSNSGSSHLMVLSPQQERTSPLDNSIFNSSYDQQSLGLVPNGMSSSGGCGGEDEILSDPLECSPNSVSPTQSPKLDSTLRQLNSVSETESESEQLAAAQQAAAPPAASAAPTQKVTPETLTPVITHKQEFIEQKQNQSQQSTGNNPQQQQQQQTSTNVNNINILLVEDNPVNARIATTVLQKYSFKVELTSNGQIALERIKQSHGSFDLILMDIHMPVMDGITCARMIRKFEGEHSLKQIPIIALTADTSAGHKNVCLEAGCNEFMPKPLDYPILISVLKKLLDNTEEIVDTNSNQTTNNSNSIISTSV